MKDHDWQGIAARTLSVYISALSKKAKPDYRPVGRIAEAQQ
jgi:hypothetical protein